MTAAKAKPRTDIFVATPMYGGMCYGTYAASLARLVDVFLSAKIPFKYGVTYNEALITRARDSLASDFMQSDSSHLMFIDADEEFDANDILSMIEADKDIICGLVPRKRIDWKQVEKAVDNGVRADELHKYTGTFAINTLGGESITEAIDSSDRKAVEVQNAGSGFMLIKREVFESLANKVPQYLSSVDNPLEPKLCKQYFNTSIDPDDNSLLSEDYHFCKLARDNGFKVWIAPWVVLSHTGTYVYSGRP